jgi:hypothetical protein
MFGSENCGKCCFVDRDALDAEQLAFSRACARQTHANTGQAA